MIKKVCTDFDIQHASSLALVLDEMITEQSFSIISHSLALASVINRSLSSSGKDTLWGSALEQRVHYSAALPNKLLWGSLICNCRAVISFRPDLACDDYREGGSSKGQARGHSEACQEFQSRPFDLWLLQYSPCTAWLCSPAPPRLTASILPCPILPCSSVLYSEVKQKINEAQAV